MNDTKDASERSTGKTVRRGGITKAGNGRVRHMLVESAWTYRHPSRIGTMKLYLLQQVHPRVRDIAWKAQTRLTGRYRALSAAPISLSHLQPNKSTR
jgi:transposase